MPHDRPGLAAFLRHARAQIDPTDVVSDGHRRVSGLRREEVAIRAGISVDYYKRLEQARGSTPTPGVAASLARALDLDPDQTDHLHRLVGAALQARQPTNTTTSPLLLDLLARLTDVPAGIITDLGDVLVHNDMLDRLTGRPAGGTPREQNHLRRWFLEPETRAVHPEQDHAELGIVNVADLRATASRRRGHADVEAFVAELRAASPEFARLWDEQHVRVRTVDHKRVRHPEVGVLHLDCRRVVDPATEQLLVVFTATPGSGAEAQLALLAALPAGYARPAFTPAETGITGAAPAPAINL